jgi:hypothetical protein
MSTVVEWKKAQEAALKAGVDTSVFSENFVKHLHKMDEELLVFFEYKSAIVKHLHTIAKVAGDYRSICENLEKQAGDDEQCRAIEQISTLLAQIDQSCIAEALLVGKR